MTPDGDSDGRGIRGPGRSRSGTGGAEHADDWAWEFRYQFVEENDAETFVRRVAAVREVTPGAAIRFLYAFAIRRSIADLVAAGRALGPDAVYVLGTAALRRSPKETAELVALQARQEGAGALLDGMIRDIAGQRTALDIAEFVSCCRKTGNDRSAAAVVDAFTRPESGRTRLDTVLLYISLRDVGCERDAADLLTAALTRLGDSLTVVQQRAADPGHPRAGGPLDDLVGALGRVSPSERLLEDWVDSRLAISSLGLSTYALIADLITEHPEGATSLRIHVATRLKHNDLARICEKLIGHPDRIDEILAGIGQRPIGSELGEIIKEWYLSAALTPTTFALLTCVVDGDPDAPAPRRLDDVENLDSELKRASLDAACGLLWYAAAHDTRGRTGEELVTILGKAAGRRGRHRAAVALATDLGHRVLDGTARPEDFVDYLARLREEGDANAAFLARKKLADAAVDHAAATDGDAEAAARRNGTVAAIAVLLHDRGPELGAQGRDILERHLENEQHLAAPEVVDLVRGVRDTLSREDRNELLRATVGRWSDNELREHAIELLAAGGFVEEAEMVTDAIR